MLDWITDFLFGSLPLRVQLGCLAVFIIAVLALLAWVHWPEAW